MFRKSNFRVSSFSIILITAALISCIAPQSFARRVAREEVRRDAVPEPRLLVPKGDVDLYGKDELEFKWSPHEGDRIQRDYYDFRLYMGYNMVESSLILKKKVLPDEFSVFIKASVFKKGAVYTWSLRQVYTGSVKSRKSYSSFHVIKKK